MFVYLKVKIQEQNNTVYIVQSQSYRASQFWQTFPFEIRESILLNIFKHNIKTWYCNSIPCYCSKTLYSPFWVYLNVSIPLYIFYDGLIHANISENFNLMTNFNVVALLILSDIPYFGVNEAYVDIYLHYFLFLSLPLNKETQYNTIQYNTFNTGPLTQISKFGKSDKILHIATFSF